MPTGVIKKEDVEKRVTVQEVVNGTVLPVQKDLTRLVQDIKSAIVKFKQVPGHWTDIIIRILGADNESQGMLQRLSAAQSLLRSCSEINYDSNLQRMAAYLGDQFNLLLDIELKITTELAIESDSGSTRAILSEIEDACNGIIDKIIGIKSFKEKVVPKQAA